MTGQEWITAFAARLGVDPPDQDTIDQLLEVASVAAHSSERLAAPLACWLIGRSGATAEDALATARSLADDIDEGQVP